MNFSNKKIFSVLLLLSTSVFNIYSQTPVDFFYKNINQQELTEYYNNEQTYSEYLNNGYNVSKDLSAGKSAKQNTYILQKLIDQYHTIILPNFSMKISKDGLTLKNKSILIFQPKSELVMEPNSLEHYQLLKIHNVKDVKVLNARLVGDRKKHTGNKGEWGYGISIRNSMNVSIRNFFIKDFWGDGIAIGYGTTPTSNNISIENGIIDNSRRNGLSVMNVNGLKINKLLVSNTNGTDPMYGIDFEPNNTKDQIDNIVLNNIKTFNNANGGMMITFNKLASSSSKNVRMKINNFEDDGSLNGLLLAGVPKNFTGINGGIQFNTINLKNNFKPVTAKLIHQSHFKINLEGVDIITPKNKNAHKQEFQRVMKTKEHYNVNIK